MQFSFVVVQYGNSGVDVERAVLEEFGRCMTQIINSAQTGWNLALSSLQVSYLGSLS